MNEAARSPHISVVVCTFNRRQQLVTAIESLLEQRTDGEFTYDIVIVDNGSIDGTRHVGEQLARSEALVSYYHEPDPGVAAARNRGVRESQGEWIAFFDDDQVADPRWLWELLNLAALRGIRAVGGAVRVQLPERYAGLPTCVRRLFGETVVQQPRAYTKKFSPGAGNLLLARSVFDDVGMFDTTLRQAGEDTDLFRRMRAHQIAAWFTPLAIVYHHVFDNRLDVASLRCLSERTGWVFALRDYAEKGTVGLWIITLSRLAQLLLIHLPLLAWQTLARSHWAQLGRQTLVWRTRGYVRGAAHATWPRWFPQQAYQTWIDFRLERTPTTAVAPHLRPARTVLDASQSQTPP